jgi:hypothetical protein
MTLDVTVPQLLELVTKKLPLELTVMEADVLELFHVPLTFPERVTLPLPHICVVPMAEMTAAVGWGFTVTTMELLEAVPHTLVRVTKYVPLWVTVRLEAVELLFQTPRPPVFPDRVTEPGAQIVVGPLAEMTGAVGTEFTVSNPAFDVAVKLLGVPMAMQRKRYPFMPVVGLVMVRVAELVPE